MSKPSRVPVVKDKRVQAKRAAKSAVAILEEALDVQRRARFLADVDGASTREVGLFTLGCVLQLFMMGEGSFPTSLRPFVERITHAKADDPLMKMLPNEVKLFLSPVLETLKDIRRAYVEQNEKLGLQGIAEVTANHVGPGPVGPVAQSGTGKDEGTGEEAR